MRKANVVLWMGHEIVCTDAKHAGELAAALSTTVVADKVFSPDWKFSTLTAHNPNPMDVTVTVATFFEDPKLARDHLESLYTENTYVPGSNEFAAEPEPAPEPEHKKEKKKSDEIHIEDIPF